MRTADELRRMFPPLGRSSSGRRKANKPTDETRRNFNVPPAHHAIMPRKFGDRRRSVG